LALDSPRLTPYSPIPIDICTRLGDPSQPARQGQKTKPEKNIAKTLDESTERNISSFLLLYDIRPDRDRTGGNSITPNHFTPRTKLLFTPHSSSSPTITTLCTLFFARHVSFPVVVSVERDQTIDPIFPDYHVLDDDNDLL
jgi:hypothetical protein